MCPKHYKQMKKYGDVLDNDPRCKSDPNEIIIYETHAEIILYDKNSQEIARALIDVEDVDTVKEYKWYLKKEGYVYYAKESIRLHRLIMDAQEDEIVDHINGDKLDNRKSNLRICTQQQNSCNNKKRKNNSSGTTGVYYSSKLSKWYSQITVNRKTIFLGYYNNAEDAIQARKDAETEYFGEFKRD